MIIFLRLCAFASLRLSSRKDAKTRKGAKRIYISKVGLLTGGLYAASSRRQVLIVVNECDGA